MNRALFILYVADQDASAHFYVETLGEPLPDPATAAGIPRAELYLLVDDPQAHHDRALAAGATELSPLQQRDWTDHVAYSLDPDGHVIAFARSANA